MISEDPEAILGFWFGRAAEDPAEAEARESFWFESSEETDALVREHFARAVEAGARGELDSWLRAPRSALALVILLDQFPRNMWRGTSQAFGHDRHALRAAREAVAKRHLPELRPLER